MKNVVPGFVFLTLAVACKAQQFPLETISIEGGSFPQAFVMKVSGLKIGQQADNTAFMEAVSRLQATGLFRTATYRYTPGPKNGYALILRLEPDDNLVDAELDLPGIQADDLWKWLQTNYPVKEHRLPENNAALSFYSHAIGEYLATTGSPQEVTTGLGSDIGPGAKVTIFFRLKNPPKVGAVKFEGTRGVSATDLETRISRLALQSDYTPLQFRDLVERNIRPIYEERGYLRVSFTIRSEKTAEGVVAVTTAISEGRTYDLAQVKIDGEGIHAEELLNSGAFKVGKIANWKEVEASISAAERPLRRDGYIGLTSRQERTLHDDAGTVDLIVHVRRGPQYIFRTLELSGLPAALEARARARWRLKSGQPLNQEYPNEYLKSISSESEFSQAKGFSTQLKVDPGSNIVDVAIAFR